MKFIIGTLLAGSGVFVGAALPNPEVGECRIADAVVRRTDPTLLDPDGEVTDMRIWHVCGYQVPTGVGSNMRAVDDEFHETIDLTGVSPEDAELVAEVLRNQTP